MSKPKKNIVLVLDGDYLVFSAMSGAEEEVDYGDDIWQLTCDHAKARKSLEFAVKRIRSRLKEFNDCRVVMAFTDDVNWRKSVLETYKANRKGKRKPVGYKAFVQWTMENYESFLRPTLEGDDCMGILSTRPKLLGPEVDEVVLVSCDKDFKTIPGRFYWLTTDQVLTLSDQDADYWHMYQAMIGDTTDGYGGIPGVGEGMAKEFLENPVYHYQAIKIMKSGARKGEEVPYWTSCKPSEVREMVDPSAPDDVPLWECIVSLAQKQGMTREELLVQAQVARICRDTDYDFKSKEVILWTPPEVKDVY